MESHAVINFSGAGRSSVGRSTETFEDDSDLNELNSNTCLYAPFYSPSLASPSILANSNGF